MEGERTPRSPQAQGPWAAGICGWLNLLLLLGITGMACVLCLSTCASYWLNSGRVVLGGIQTHFQMRWIHINIMALGTTHPGKPEPSLTCCYNQHLISLAQANRNRTQIALAISVPPCNLPTSNTTIYNRHEGSRSPAAAGTCTFPRGFLCDCLAAVSVLFAKPWPLPQCPSSGNWQITFPPSMLEQLGLLPPPEVISPRPQCRPLGVGVSEERGRFYLWTITFPGVRFDFAVSKWPQGSPIAKICKTFSK